MSEAPSRFSDLIGQSHAVAVLRNAIRRDRVAHAYLFAGPEGVGKSTAARLFAQALNCEQAAAGGEPDACGECRSCVLIAQGSHPDVRLLCPAGDDESSVIPIADLRDGLVYDAHLRPVSGRRKVYILDPADRTAPHAIQTLLKVLEEPPPYVVIILVTAHPALLPPTVPSRCQLVAFELAGTEAVEKRLLASGMEPGPAAALAALSGGRVGWAIGAAERPEVLNARAALLEVCAAAAGHSLAGALRLAEEIKLQGVALARARAAKGKGEAESEEDEEEMAPRGASVRALRAELPWCLEVVASWYRDLMAAWAGAAVTNADYVEAAHRHLSEDAARHAQDAIEAILAARQQVQRNANIDLTLEALAIELLGGRGRVHVGAEPQGCLRGLTSSGG